MISILSLALFKTGPPGSAFWLANHLRTVYPTVTLIRRLQERGLFLATDGDFILATDRERADGIPNVVWRTLRAREGGLPTHMILVLEPGIGDTVFCIDTSRVDAEGKSPVIEWIDGAKASEQDLEPYAADFSDFAVKMMNLGLEIEAEQDEEED